MWAGGWSRERGLQLFQRGNGLRSAKSPNHYPIELARKALAEKRKRAKQLAPIEAEAKRYGLILPRR